MNFGTKSINVEERKSLGISYGILKLKLMDFAFKTAQSGKKQLEFFVEDDIPVGEDGYEYEGVFGKRKALNKSGRVGATIYFDTNNETEVNAFVGNFIVVLADKLDCRNELSALDEENFNSLEDYLKKVMKVIGNKYIYLPTKAEEYVSQSTGKTGINRTFKYWGKDKPLIAFPVEGSVVTKDGNKQILTSADGKTFTWDKDNQYDYKPFVKPDAEIQEGIAGNSEPGSDLPF